MFGSVGSPPSKWNISLALVYLIYFLVLSSNQVNSDEIIDNSENSTLEIPADDAIPGDELASNRVLPVDAAHKNKISTPLEAYCVQTIRENLVKFLKRHPQRKGRQDDGDDGDGDGEEGIAGVLGNLAEGNGALSTLSQIPAAIPGLVNTLTQLSGAVNQGLNGTDTPNIPSFLVRQGMEAIKFFQAIAGAAQSSQASRPSEVHVQRIPGQPNPNNRRPGQGGPGPAYEPYPGQVPGGGGGGGGQGGQSSVGGLDPDDYLDEDVKQPLQPTLAPFTRPGGAGYDPNNPFLQGSNLLNQQPGGAGGDPAAEGLPQGTSLWQIYKSFRTQPNSANGTLSEFQLAHPEAFSNELLHSISMAISSIRGQTNEKQVPTDRPSSEIFKMFYPQKNNTEPPPPSIFSNANRPTLSVYKPSGSISGVGIDLSNLAINASQTIINANRQPTQASEVEDTPASGEETTPAPQEDVEAPPPPPVGTQRPVKDGAILVSTGTLEKLQAQNARKTTPKPDGPQFVKSPTSSHQVLQMGEYIPSISNVHEGDETIQQFGPMLNMVDRKNGFNNKQPYKPVLNGILLEAPRLTPSPLYQKRPSGIQINTDTERTFQEDPQNTSPQPQFHFQVGDQNKPGIPPNYHGPDPTTRRSPTLIAAIPSKFDYERNNQQVKPGSGVAPSSLFAQPTDAVPDSDIERTTPVPEVEQGAPEEDIQSAGGNGGGGNGGGGGFSSFIKQQGAAPLQPPSAPMYQQQQFQPLQQVRPQQQLLPPLQQLPQPQLQGPASNSNNANRLLQQLLFLQSVLQREQENRRRQNIQTIQTAIQKLTVTTIEPPTTSPPIEQEQEVESENEQGSEEVDTTPPQQSTFPPEPITLPTNPFQSAPGYGSSNFGGGGILPPKQDPSTIANGFASALVNNLNPNSNLLAAPNKAFINNQPVYINRPPAAGSFANGELVDIDYSNSRNDTVNNFNAPLRTSTKSPNFKVPPTKPPGPIRFQQFPNFASGPSSYFPSATGLRPVEPEKVAQGPFTSAVLTGGISAQTNWGPNNIAPPVVQSNNPALSNVINPDSEPAQIPHQTTRPISGAFKPYNPFGNFEIHLESSEVQAPAVAVAPPFKFQISQNSVTQAAVTTPATTTTTTTTTTPAPTVIPPIDATTKAATSLPPLSSLNFFRPSGGYYPSAGLPVPVVGSSSGSSGALSQNGPSSQSGPNLPPPSPPKFQQRPPPSNDPYSILTNPQFQRPAQSGGYPQFVPINNPSIITSSGIKTPSGGQSLQAPSTGTLSLQAPSISTTPISVPAPVNATAPPQLIKLGTAEPSNDNSSFGQKLTTKLTSTSAIGEMARLPFYQEDSFRPSALPPHIIAGPSTTQNPEEDNSFEEQSETKTNKPFNELFSSSSNVSVDTKESSGPVTGSNSVASPGLEGDSSTAVPAYSSSGAEENDSAEEQPYPNFPPGKPVYWMNMYYPSGVPVLTKVTSTSAPTTPKPRRRKTRSTTTPAPTTTLPPEPEYYEEEEDDTNKKAKKKRKGVKTTTEADF